MGINSCVGCFYYNETEEFPCMRDNDAYPQSIKPKCDDSPNNYSYPLIKERSTKMKIVNLTADPYIAIICDNGDKIFIEREQEPARIRTHQITLIHDPIPIKVTVLDEITGLPDPCDDTIYVCSYLVARYANREDVVCPNTFPGEAVRHNGKLIGVKSLQAVEVRI
jgi:hypothetical protein